MRIPDVLLSLTIVLTLAAVVSADPAVVTDPVVSPGPAVIATPTVTATPADGDAAEGVMLPIAVFELRGGGALYHLEGGTFLGQKAFKNKIKAADVMACVDGQLQCGPHMDPDEVNDGGTVYLYIYDESTWGVTTTGDPSQTVVPEAGPPVLVPVTILRGLMDGKGRFMFAGTHAASQTDMVFEGKAALEKGTLTPKKVSGKLQAVSIEAEHWSKANVKTFGASLFTPGS
jgi:hypothetical protein